MALKGAPASSPRFRAREKAYGESDFQGHISDYDRIAAAFRKTQKTFKKWGFQIECCVGDGVHVGHKEIMTLQKDTTSLAPKRMDSKGEMGGPAASPRTKAKELPPDDALLWACARSDIVRAKDSLTNGANADCKDQNGMRPLHFACASGSLEAVKMLLNPANKAGVNALPPKAPDGFKGLRVSPVLVAIMKGEKEIVEYLADKHNALEHELCPKSWDGPDGWNQLLPEISRGIDFTEDELPPPLWPSTKRDDPYAAKYPQIDSDAGGQRQRRQRMRAWLEGREEKKRQREEAMEKLRQHALELKYHVSVKEIFNEAVRDDDGYIAGINKAGFAACLLKKHFVNTEWESDLIWDLLGLSKMEVWDRRTFQEHVLLGSDEVIDKEEEKKNAERERRAQAAKEAELQNEQAPDTQNNPRQSTMRRASIALQEGVGKAATKAGAAVASMRRMSAQMGDFMKSMVGGKK